jgi:hypothetical protein
MTHPSPAILAALADMPVLGNVEAFLAYVEDGRAAQDWDRLVLDAMRRDERWLQAQARSWLSSAESITS